MGDEGDYDCALCHELLFEPVVSPCGHTFCRDCLRRCLREGQRGSRRCPLCRRLLHATAYQDLVVCAPLARLLETRFPEAYAERRAGAAAPEDLAQPGVIDELPLMVLDSMLPRQRLNLNIFEYRYRAMVRAVLAGGRRFGMVGFGADGRHHTHGVEVEIEECIPQPDGRFHLQVVGTHIFRIEEESEQPEGYISARVARATVDEEEQSDADTAAAQELQPMLDEWLALVRAEWPLRVATILAAIGEMPPPQRPNDLALWVGMLVNPLPPLSVAPEIRPDMLSAENVAERLQIARYGLGSSLSYLRALAKSPMRRCIRHMAAMPSFAIMVATVVLGCTVSSLSPAWVKDTLARVFGGRLGLG